MNIDLHILNASGRLDQFVKDIEEEFKSTVERVTKVLPIENVDVVVWDNPEWAIKKYGIGGHTISANSIAISIDPDNPNSKKSFKENFSSTLMHEFHHICRWKTIGYGSTRLEVSISEGLAEHFEIQMTGKASEIWDTALSEKQLKKFVGVAKENKSTNYYLYDWLFGNKEKGIPDWCGYSVGFYLVSEYLSRNPDIKPHQIYSKKAKEFIFIENLLQLV